MTHFIYEDNGEKHIIPAKAVMRAFFPEQGHTLSSDCPCVPTWHGAYHHYSLEEPNAPA